MRIGLVGVVTASEILFLIVAERLRSLFSRFPFHMVRESSGGRIPASVERKAPNFPVPLSLLDELLIFHELALPDVTAEEDFHRRCKRNRKQSAYEAA